MRRVWIVRMTMGPQDIGFNAHFIIKFYHIYATVLHHENRIDKTVENPYSSKPLLRFYD